MTRLDDLELMSDDCLPTKQEVKALIAIARASEALFKKQWSFSYHEFSELKEALKNLNERC